MNRKVEKRLAWIANILSLLFLIFGILSIFVINNTSNQQQYNELMKQFSGNNQDMSSEMFLVSLIASLVILGFSTLLGFVGTMVIEGRKNLAASLLIAAAIVGLFTTNLIAMVLWMIAAIRLFAKKDKTDVNENATAQLRQNHSKSQSDWNHQQHQQHKDAWDPEQEINKQKKDDPYIY